MFMRLKKHSPVVNKVGKMKPVRNMVDKKSHVRNNVDKKSPVLVNKVDKRWIYLWRTKFVKHRL